MKICGIIAEYNPFHNGHAHHLAQTKAALCAENPQSIATIAVMSGNFVQRGDFAILEKYQRAQIAVENGIDLVLELPLHAALSSADDFALGGVSLLHQLGCVDALSFGSECGDMAQITTAAALRHHPAFQKALQQALGDGLSYAAATTQAAHAVHVEAGVLLASPNNTLGIAYCAALQQLGSEIQPITVTRHGNAHDTAAFAGDATLPSASQLRQYLLQGDLDTCAAGISATTWERLQAAHAQGLLPAQIATCDMALLAHLRRFSAAQLQPYCGGNDGFAARLHASIQAGRSFAEICGRAQTKRYPLARVRRALLRAYLDLPLATTGAQYARVLAIGAHGAQILRQCKAHATLPLLTKPIAEKQLPAHLQPLLQQDALADELYALSQPRGVQTAGVHYRSTPYVLR